MNPFDHTITINHWEQDVIRIEIFNQTERVDWCTVFMDDDYVRKGYLHLHCPEIWLPLIVEYLTNTYPHLGIQLRLSNPRWNP